jgi:hypothetical protein
LKKKAILQDRDYKNNNRDYYFREKLTMNADSSKTIVPWNEMLDEHFVQKRERILGK